MKMNWKEKLLLLVEFLIGLPGAITLGILTNCRELAMAIFAITFIFSATFNPDIMSKLRGE